MKVKIGQIIKFKTDHEISLAGGGTALVKEGDTAQVLRKIDEMTAEVVYLSGEASGKSQHLLMEVDENIDADAIARKIMEELNK